jgi:hypothetical protein
MFYSQTLLAKKGALGQLWLAAFHSKKIDRKTAEATDISKSAAMIREPVTPLALRVSGQLLVGLVRIYNKKIYILHESTRECQHPPRFCPVVHLHWLMFASTLCVDMAVQRLRSCICRCSWPTPRRSGAVRAL